MIGQQLEPEADPLREEDAEGNADSSLSGSSLEEEICGCVLSVRGSEDVISVRCLVNSICFVFLTQAQIWNRNIDKGSALRRAILSKRVGVVLPQTDGRPSFLANTYKTHRDNIRPQQQQRQNYHHNHNKKHHNHQHQRKTGGGTADDSINGHDSMMGDISMDDMTSLSLA